MLLNANQISTADQPDPLILLAIEDITERKRAEEDAARSREAGFGRTGRRNRRPRDQQPLGHPDQCHVPAEAEHSALDQPHETW